MASDWGWENDKLCLDSTYPVSEIFLLNHLTSLQVTETSYIMLIINHVAKSTVKVSHISKTIILSNSTCLKQGDIFSSLSSKLYAFSLSTIFHALRMWLSVVHASLESLGGGKNFISETCSVSLIRTFSKHLSVPFCFLAAPLPHTQAIVRLTHIIKSVFHLFSTSTMVCSCRIPLIFCF